MASLRREWTDEWYGRSADPAYRDAFAAWWRSEADRRVMWVASSQVTIVGMINLVEFRRMPRPGQPPSGWGYISNVYVRRDCRNQGIGHKLLGAAITEAERRGYERLVLNPSERSTNLYARAGFAPALGLFALTLPRERA